MRSMDGNKSGILTTIAAGVVVIGLFPAMLDGMENRVNARSATVEDRLGSRIDPVESRRLSIEDHLRSAPAPPPKHKGVPS